MLVYAEEIQEVILQTKRKTGQNFVLWISGPISTVVQAFYLVECHIKNQDQAIRRNRSILFLQNVLKSNYICQESRYFEMYNLNLKLRRVLRNRCKLNSF